MRTIRLMQVAKRPRRKRHMDRLLNNYQWDARYRAIVMWYWRRDRAAMAENYRAWAVFEVLA